MFLRKNLARKGFWYVLNALGLHLFVFYILLVDALLTFGRNGGQNNCLPVSSGFCCRSVDPVPAAGDYRVVVTSCHLWRRCRTVICKHQNNDVTVCCIFFVFFFQQLVPADGKETPTLYEGNNHEPVIRKLFSIPSDKLTVDLINANLSWYSNNIYRKLTAKECSREDMHHDCCFFLGLYSLSSKTSYLQISWRLEAVRLNVIMIVSPWTLTGIFAAEVPNFRAIEKVSDLGSRCFDTSRDLAVSRPSATWIEAQLDAGYVNHTMYD